MLDLNLTAQERKKLLSLLIAQLASVYAHPTRLPVSQKLNEEEIRSFARQLRFDQARDPEEVLLKILEGMKKYAVHTPHTGYFGLFNPRPGFLSALADYITAVFNPQLAAWSHAPFANEAERHVIFEFGKKMGYPASQIDGTFCTGGAESNLTAILCALQRCFPAFSEKGIRSLSKHPLIYCSSESHHSIAKAAKITGLGHGAVRSIPVKEDLTMDLKALQQALENDRRGGHLPFMLIGTAGTTGAGAIDALPALAGLARKYDLWFHVDAAYGGAIAISSKHRKLVEGIEQSDSVTLDIHKWFSVPMAASLFLTSNKNILHRTFDIKTAYMPTDGYPETIIDPYVHSIQWSRRFTGLKIYLPLAVHGWEGFEEVINHQMELGTELRKLLQQEGWQIKNRTALPVICFSNPDILQNNAKVKKLAERIVHSGKSWISTYPINGKLTLRACITNYATTNDDLKNLIFELNDQITNN